MATREAKTGAGIRAAQMIRQAVQEIGLIGTLEEVSECVANPELKGALRRCLQEVRSEEKRLSVETPGAPTPDDGWTVEKTPRLEGVVKVFKEEGGYGFIGVPNQRDVFVHRSAMRGGPTSLEEGQRVRFSVVPGPKGPQAHDVEII